MYDYLAKIILLVESRRGHQSSSFEPSTPRIRGRWDHDQESVAA